MDHLSMSFDSDDGNDSIPSLECDTYETFWDQFDSIFDIPDAYAFDFIRMCFLRGITLDVPSRQVLLYKNHRYALTLGLNTLPFPFSPHNLPPLYETYYQEISGPYLHLEANQGLSDDE
jgi:hypothetical protein